ncbi:hypothetical protein SFR_2823 [Streptomyces sp. FR-008]|nr:hypothetical protein SFR_2823 [Streptomyces sp. FR-008]
MDPGPGRGPGLIPYARRTTPGHLITLEKDGS